jgi:hypothetical protein
MNNNKSSFKSRTHDNQNSSKAYHNKPKASNDKNKIAAKPTREDMICFNCEELGHYARDCKKPKQVKSHVQAAHTAIIDKEDNDDHDQDDQTSEYNTRQSTGSQNYKSDEEEMVEVNVYDNNNWYDCVSDTEHMFMIGETDQNPVTKTCGDGPAQNIDKAHF